MGKEINELLDEAIVQLFADIKTNKSGTNEKHQAITELETLYKLKIDDEKLELEANEKADDRGLESEKHVDETRCKEAEIYEQIKDRKFKVCIEAAGIILPLIFYGIWMNKGLKFEETGTFTSTTLRGLFNQFKTKK